MNELTLMMSVDENATLIDTNPKITFNTSNDEILRIAKDGFYVRGVKIEQDSEEAEKVYNAFHSWLTWTTLNRTY